MPTTLLLVCSIVAGQAGTFGPGQIRHIEQACTATSYGQPLVALEHLSAVVNRCSDAQFAELTAMLERRQLPPPGKIFATLRLTLVQQDFGKDIPRPGAREAALVLAEIKGLIEPSLEKPDVRRPRRHENIDAVTVAINELIVEQRQLESIQRIVQYTKTLVRAVSRRERNRMSEDDDRFLETAPQKWMADVQSALTEVEGLQTCYRLNRMNMGLTALAPAQLTKDKFKAAYFFEQDANRILDYLGSYRSDKERPRSSHAVLRDSQLFFQVKADAQKGRELAGDLAHNAQLLFDGLDWWYRGRYGEGTDYSGLAKSVMARRTPGGLLWLELPATEPTPTPWVAAEAAPSESVPRFVRRHGFVWAIDDVFRLQYVMLSKNDKLRNKQLAGVVCVTKYR